MHKILPIFIIFPIMVLIFGLKKKSSFFKFAIYLAFVFIFIMSEVGADYEAYKGIFVSIGDGQSFSSIHGEIGFLLVVKLFNLFGISYEMFRIIFLSVSLGIMCYYVNKMSPNFALSFFILFLGYIAYMVSAYRQMLTMALMLGSVYHTAYTRRYKKAMLFSLVGTFMHISGVVGIHLYY